MRLAFIVCRPYHGSTLLHLLLNNHAQISALGDANPTRAYDQVCACGLRVSACDQWRDVAEHVGAGRFSRSKLLLPILPSPLHNYRIEGRAIPVSPSARLNRAVGLTAAAALDVILPTLWRPTVRCVTEYLDTYDAYYRLVLGRHGTSLVVDGSKSGRKVELFAGSGHDVKVIHLMRDPRGFAASWSHHENEPDLGATAWRWNDLHGRYSRLQDVLPYRLVRYEDLVARPEDELRGIFDFLGVDDEEVIGPPRYPEKHHLMGNRALFAFDGTIEPDERWRERLTAAQQQRVLERAGERAARHGYRGRFTERSLTSARVRNRGDGLGDPAG